MPFLGAGISQCAPSRSIVPAPAEHHHPLKAVHLAKRLSQKLASAAAESSPPLSEQSRWGHLVQSFAGTEPQLGEVAELCWATIGPIETVRLLEFETWNRFLPTSAHHYLAVLVREGCLTEVMETNYDHFVERAVWETFAREGTEFGYVDAPTTHEEAPVVHDLRSCRAHLGAPRDDVGSKNLVRVIKLNGCAAAWTKAKESGCDTELAAASRAIGLTEEQLQGWSGKEWARDLLQASARSRSLFFVGFRGSDPLVRHHLVEVLREFRSLSHQSSSGAEPWRENNAPFVADFSDNLSFSQFQLLRAHGAAHVASFEPPSVYNNTFLGTDGSGIRRRLHGPAVAESKNLPADDLLALVAARATERLLCDRFLSRTSPLHAYLRGAFRHPDSVLALLRTALRDSDGAEVPSVWTTWMLLREPSSPAQRASAWAQACFALRGESAHRAGYRPFLASPVKQPMLLVLLMLIRRALGCSSKLPDATELGQLASIEEPGKAGSVPLGVRLMPEHRHVIATSQVDMLTWGWKHHPHPEGVPSQLILIALGRGTVTYRQQVRVVVSHPTPDEPGVLLLRHLHVLGDLAALRGPEDRDGCRLPEVEANLRHLVQDPAAWTSRASTWRQHCMEVS